MKKQYRMTLVFILIIALCMVTLSSCSQPAPKDTNVEPSKAPDAAAPYKMSIVSGASGGTYYVMGAALAEVMNNRSDIITANSEASGGSFENARLVADRQATIGMSAADIVTMAYNGTDAFINDPAENLRFVMSAMANVYQIVVPEASDVKTVADIKGKNFSIGPQGHPTMAIDFLMNTYGYLKDRDYKGQYLAHAQAAEAIRDNQVDGMIVAVSPPVSAITELATTNKIRLLSLSDQEIANLQAAEDYYIPYEIAENTYPTQTEPVKTVKIPVYMITTEDVPEEVIYEFTKLVLENNEDLVKVHVAGNEFKLETALEGMSIPLHPGAEKYYKEKGLIK